LIMCKYLFIRSFVRRSPFIHKLMSNLNKNMRRSMFITLRQLKFTEKCTSIRK
jgi:hypothetical protein